MDKSTVEKHFQTTKHEQIEPQSRPPDLLKFNKKIMNVTDFLHDPLPSFSSLFFSEKTKKEPLCV